MKKARHGKRAVRHAADDRQLIDFLGGARALRERLNLPVEQKAMVAMWRSRNCIARAWRPTIAELAEKESVVPPEGFLSPSRITQEAV